MVCCIKKGDKRYAAVDDAIKFSCTPHVVLYEVTLSVAQFKLQQVLLDADPCDSAVCGRRSNSEPSIE